MGTTLFIVMILVGVILVGAYVFLNPNILGKLARKAEEAQEAIENVREQSVNVAPSSLRQTASVTRQLEGVQPGQSFHFDPAGDATSVTTPKYGVKGRGRFQAQKFSKGSGFSPKGEEYLFLTCDGLIVLKRPDGWYFFTERTGLVGEGAHDFDAIGEEFGQHAQKARSVSFDWDERSWEVLDIGYMLYVHEDGESYIDDGQMVKYMLAECGNEVFYLENQKSESDSVWIGIALGSSLDGFVFDIQ